MTDTAESHAWSNGRERRERLIAVAAARQSNGKSAEPEPAPESEPARKKPGPKPSNKRRKRRGRKPGPKPRAELAPLPELRASIVHDDDGSPVGVDLELEAARPRDVAIRVADADGEIAPTTIVRWRLKL